MYRFIMLAGVIEIRNICDGKAFRHNDNNLWLQILLFYFGRTKLLVLGTRKVIEIMFVIPVDLFLPFSSSNYPYFHSS